MTRTLFITVVVALLMGWQNAFAAAPRTREATAKILDTDFQTLSWKSIGLLMVQVDDTTRLFLNGFFIAPNIFLTSIVPGGDNETGFVCDRPTYIFTEKLRISPDFELKETKPDFKCKAIVQSSPSFGFLAIEVEPLEEDRGQPEVIELMDSSIAQAINLDMVFQPMFMVGYDYGTEGARLHVADGCQTLALQSPFPDSYLAGNPTLGDARYYWASLACSYRTGMRGSPILIRHRRQWYAVGIVASQVSAPQTGNTKIPAGSDIIVFPVIERLTRIFGKDLTGGSQ